MFRCVHVRAVAVLLLAAWLCPVSAAPAAEPGKAAVVLVSETACAVSVDGSKVAEIQADEPLRLELASGEYVLSAIATDGRRWSKVLRVESPKTIVQIAFDRMPPSSRVPVGAAGASPSVSPPAMPGSISPGSTPPASVSWVLVPPGEFEMGCSPGDTECNPAELPPRHVRVSNGFEIMDRLVTVAQFRDWASSSQRRLPSQPKWSTDDAPVVNVTWDEAAAFCAASVARLPTEIEWEFAARAGSPAPRYGEIDAIAWYAGNSDKRAHPVGRKAPNGFGLYDMLGNVWEWTEDCWNASYAGAPPDAVAWTAGDCTQRVCRGGSWSTVPRFARSAARHKNPADYRDNLTGFRLARTLE